MIRTLTAFLLIAGSSLLHAQSADLSITATVDHPHADTGGNLTVTLTARNNGPDPSISPSIGVAFGTYSFVVLSATAPPDWTCNLSSTITCSTPSLAPGDQATFVIMLVVPSDSSFVDGTGFVNPGGTLDPDFHNNTAPFPLGIYPAPATADLLMQMQLRQDPVLPGKPIVVDATVENSGPDLAPGALVWLSGPAGTTVSGVGWTCEQRMGGSLCHGGAIAVGAAAVITMTSPPGADESSPELWAWVQGEEIADPNPRNNFAAVTASVADPANYELLLVPLTDLGTPGADGSMWQTDLRMIADEDIAVFPRHANCVIPEGCPPYSLPVATLWDPVGDVVAIYARLQRGSLIYTHRGDAEKLHFTLRIRDISHPDDDWGTSIPIARESDFRSTKIVIAGVPIDPAFRVTLRVYDPDRRDNPQAIVKYLDESGNVLVQTRRSFDVAAAGQMTPALLPLFPAYMQVDVGSEAAPALRSTGRITVQIEPGVTGQRLWAFVSVTSNTTQHVTVLTAD